MYMLQLGISAMLFFCNKEFFKGNEKYFKTQELSYIRDSVMVENNNTILVTLLTYMFLYFYVCV